MCVSVSVSAPVCVSVCLLMMGIEEGADDEV